MINILKKKPVVVSKEPLVKEKVQRYVRVDKVEVKKKDGWKVIVKATPHDRILGVKVSALGKGEPISDLVLMEK